jgi:uncharacterized protein
VGRGDDRRRTPQRQRLLGAERLGPTLFPRVGEAHCPRAVKGQGRVGSDYPTLPNERIFREWGELGYSDEVLEHVYHLNAERMLGL